MAPGAELRLATDIPDYARHALEAVAAAPGFAVVSVADAPWPGWPGTRYEAKALRRRPPAAVPDLPPPLTFPPAARTGIRIVHALCIMCASNKTPLTLGIPRLRPDTRRRAPAPRIEPMDRRLPIPYEGGNAAKTGRRTVAGHGEPKPMRAEASGPLRGRVEVPGDKSISHRALILGALAVGETRISGLLEGQDVLDTGRAMRAFGATVERTGSGAWRVEGVGVGGFQRARGRDRPRQLRHRRAPRHGRDGDHRHHRHLHRRRQPARPADGADHRAPRALRRRGARPPRRACCRSR